MLWGDLLLVVLLPPAGPLAITAATLPTAAAGPFLAVRVPAPKPAVAAGLPISAVPLARLPAAVQVVLIIVEILATLNAMDSLMVIIVTTWVVILLAHLVRRMDQYGNHIKNNTAEDAREDLASRVVFT